MVEISEEKRKEYLKIKEEYDSQKSEINKKVGKSQLIINKHKQKINQLEKELRQSRPILEECDNYMVCERCDIRSMKFEGIEPGQGGRSYWYECVICGKEDYHT